MTEPADTGADAHDPRARLDALLEQALELHGDAREAFVAAIESDNTAIAHELRALLRFASDDSDHLQPGRAGNARWRSLFDAAPPTETIDETLPERIGVWQPMRRIGHGGMGTVYLVERNDAGFHQSGALKLLRPGAESEEFLERFARERQILASLTHPGIARLLDGGRSLDGRPYLVMEYVEGEALDRACDRRALDIDARIALFVEIAEAVAYAHRNLVAHRDLKPSNILIGDDGRPKLLDFGIAKALSEASGEELQHTRTALRAFTPDYAAPEQVLGQPTSTATDLYQLGLLLYELLTGHRAQHASDASQRALEDAICNSEPIRPSEHIGDDDRERCAARDTTPSALRRKLRGDLDNIVLRALRKAPERRYPSANALIDDLERWRTGRPVRARPETWRYRSGKFLKRNAWAVAAGVAIFALISGYAITATLQAQAIARERDRAQAEAAKAQQVLALTRQLFRGANPDASGSASLTARDLLDRGWADIERELKDQPAVQIELLDTVGEAYRQLGDYDRAKTLFEAGLKTSRAFAQSQPLVYARALRSLGRVGGDQGDYADAERRLRQALSIYRSTPPVDRAEVAATLSSIALLLDERGDYPGSETRYRDALAIRRSLYGERHADVAESLGNLGMILRRRGDYAGAEPLLSQALSVYRQVLQNDHPKIADTIGDLAQVRNDLGEYDSAEALYREALASMEKSLGPDHPESTATMITLARVLKTRRDYGGARILLERSLAIRKKALGNKHPHVALNLNDLGQLHFESGDLAQAKLYFEQALAAYSGDDPGRAMTISNLGQIAENNGDYSLAERRYREALAIQRKHSGDEHDRVGMHLHRLGMALHRQGRSEEAETTLLQALAIYRKRLPAGHQRLAVVLLPLGTLLIDRGRREEAEPLLKEALRVRKDAFGDDDLRTVEVAAALARTAPKN